MVKQIFRDQVIGFVDFIRARGVVGFAVGFIIGGAVSTVVRSLVDNIINPLIGLLLSPTQALTDLIIPISGVSLKVGDFLNALINFMVITAVVYIGLKILKLDRLDKPN
ncbi:MAG: MscL family protein [Candidatus Taylorbacteria bacterium]|nr:MscL family protein [Candidatus Taylorbacteria bacterium]